MLLRVVHGDITEQPVDVIVTAANTHLRGGGGVDGAVHRAAGPELLKACRPLAPCSPGSAVVTPAFELKPVRWVVHAVGPIYSGPTDAPVLASAYASALRCAEEVEAKTVALPSISTGVYGYPIEDAAEISVKAIQNLRTSIAEVLLVAFDDRTATAWEAALSSKGA